MPAADDSGWPQVALGQSPPWHWLARAAAGRRGALALARLAAGGRLATGTCRPRAVENPIGESYIIILG